MTYHSRLLPVLYFACVPAIASCIVADVLGPPGDVKNVLTTLQFPGHMSHVYLMLGDRDTIRATAHTHDFVRKLKYDSAKEPRRFRYSSTNPAIATVDMDGAVTTLSVGLTDLTASVDGVTSSAMRLAVSPRATSLSAEPAAVSVRVNDTLSVSFKALDQSGKSVPGLLFYVALDTPFWDVIGAPIGRYANGAYTPAVLHFKAQAAGNARITATVMNEKAESRFQMSVPITVQAR